MKRRLWFIVLFLTVLGSVAWLGLRGPREPVYQGHSLTYWLRRSLQQDDPQAVEALRHIGTNAIPTLLRWTRAHQSPLKLKLIALAQKQDLIGIGFIGHYPAGALSLTARKGRWLDFRLTHANTWNSLGYYGFERLGAAASNAVPALSEIYDANISPASQQAAAQALGFIGPAAEPAVPSLLRTLAVTNDYKYASGLYANYPHRYGVLALHRMHAKPQLVVPALMKSLSDPDWHVRDLAADTLGQYGPDAASAVPLLTNLLQDPNAVVRQSATNALQQIDPAAARADSK